MSDKTISAGDVVRVVFGCCAQMRQEIGFVGTVHKFKLDGHCLWCGYSYSGSVADLTSRDVESICFPTPWLIKENPPAKSETLEQGEVLHA